MAGAAHNEPAHYRNLLALAMSNARQYEVNHNIHSMPTFLIQYRSGHEAHTEHFCGGLVTACLFQRLQNGVALYSATS
jgi:hypothetical protein